MNIRSTLTASEFFFKNITSEMLLTTVMLAILLIIFIIGCGQGLYIKLSFIILGSLISMSIAEGEKNNYNSLVTRYFTIILMTLVLVEIPLALNSTTTQITPITTVTLKTTKQIPLQSSKNDAQQYKEEQIHQIQIIDLHTNAIISTIDILSGEESKLKLYEEWKTKVTYINYFPFFIYEEKVKYSK